MKFYSQSKRAWLDVETANTTHLTNLKNKIARGEYRNAEGEVLSADEEKDLLAAIDATLERRAAEEAAKPAE